MYELSRPLSNCLVRILWIKRALEIQPLPELAVQLQWARAILLRCNCSLRSTRFPSKRSLCCGTWSFSRRNHRERSRTLSCEHGSRSRRCCGKSRGRGFFGRNERFWSKFRRAKGSASSWILCRARLLVGLEKEETVLSRKTLRQQSGRENQREKRGWFGHHNYTKLAKNTLINLERLLEKEVFNEFQDLVALKFIFFPKLWPFFNQRR